MNKSQYDQQAEYLEKLGAAQEEAESNARAIEAFLRRHEQDGLILCDANRRVIFLYMSGSTIDETNLEDAWNSHPAFRKSLAQNEGEANTRAAVIREVRDLLTGSDSAKDHAIQQLRYSTIPELVTRRDELQRRAQLQSLPKEELRKITSAPLKSQFQPIEPLYQNPEAIRSAAPAVIRRLIRFSGLDAVNEILSRKSKD